MATASVPNGDGAAVYNAAMQAALSAGFTITNTDQESGFIVATRGANPLLSYNDPVININVIELEDEVSLTVSSTISGQVVDYGTTKSTIEDFCAALSLSLPESSCVFRQ
jgi:hypothetical protein